MDTGTHLAVSVMMIWGLTISQSIPSIPYPLQLKEQA